MDDHPYGWLSLLPPLIAIVLAIITRRAVVSLLVGVFCGALITAGGNPLVAVWETCELHLWPTLIDPGKMRVFAFTLLMGAMVGVISKSGGMQGLVNLLAPLARGRRSGQLTTWLLGLVIFFDDYTNTILLGSTLRGVCDRLKISREKLAYLVDSTAAPVASLALLSTWIAVELDYIGDGLTGTQSVAGLSPIELFIASIPYRFYAVMALLLVPMIGLAGRDFGPMLKAERAAPRETGRTARALIARNRIRRAAAALVQRRGPHRRHVDRGRLADLPLRNGICHRGCITARHRGCCRFQHGFDVRSLGRNIDRSMFVPGSATAGQVANR